MPYKDRERYNLFMRDYRKGKKDDRIKTHGGKCETCGEGKMEFLTIAYRKKKPMVLCWNCRFSKKIKVEKK